MLAAVPPVEVLDHACRTWKKPAMFAAISRASS